jgi:hypothetical protein
MSDWIMNDMVYSSSLLLSSFFIFLIFCTFAYVWPVWSVDVEPGLSAVLRGARRQSRRVRISRLFYYNCLLISIFVRVIITIAFRWWPRFPFIAFMHCLQCLCADQEARRSWKVRRDSRGQGIIRVGFGLILQSLWLLLLIFLFWIFFTLFISIVSMVPTIISRI